MDNHLRQIKALLWLIAGCILFNAYIVRTGSDSIQATIKAEEHKQVHEIKFP